MSSQVSLNDINEDIWATILQFLSLNDILQGKLINISSRVFFSLIGCEISHQNYDQQNFGVIYRILNEKLIKQQLENTIQRITGRKLAVYVCDDYEIRTNSFKLITFSNEFESKYTRSTFYTKSRLNIEPCGTSMSELRGRLKKLIKICNEQFPHLYVEFQSSIRKALERSVKVCTRVNEPIGSQKEEVEIVENYHEADKPSIWSDEKREKSIRIELKKPKSKQFKWRLQFIHLYRNYLLYELEYNITYLKTTFKYFKAPRLKFIVNPETYGKILNSIYEILDKFNQEFKVKFLTEREFFIETKNSIDDRSSLKNFDFISHSTMGLIKIYKRYKNYNNFVFNEMMRNQIDRNMTLYAKYFENDLMREINPNHTIYHYLLRTRDTQLIDKHIDSNIVEEFTKSPEHLHSKLVNYYIHAFIPDFEFFISLSFVTLLETLNEKELSLDILFKNPNLFTSVEKKDESLLEAWLNFFIKLFGMQPMLKAMSQSISIARDDTPLNLLKRIAGV